MAITFTLSALFFIVAWGLWIRREISQSYPADGPAESAEDRIASVESVRRFRIQIIYWLQIAASVLFFSAAALVIEIDRGAISERTVGFVGGIGGAVIGTAGGVLGTMASIRAHRAQRIAMRSR